MRYIEGINRKSKIAFPEYIDDYITEDNPVRIIDAFVETLNLIELGFKNSRRWQGDALFASWRRGSKSSKMTLRARERLEPLRF